MDRRLLQHPLDFRNRYRRRSSLIARLCRDGVLGLNGAWRRRWPAPNTRRPSFEVARS